MVNQKFPPDLVYRVRASIGERGFCVFGNEEMDRLLSAVRGNRAIKRQVLEEFAALSGTKMETTPNLNSARFVNPLTVEGAGLVLRSPVCQETTMRLSEIEPGLVAYTCPKSGGVWIPLQSYLDWRGRQPQGEAPLPETYVPALSDDSKQRALICPESGRLLIRYRVGHGLKFHVDLSTETGGIWLDKGEWEALKSKGLHVELNLIFTAPYQRQIRAEEHEEAMGQMFRSRIGQEDFAKAAEFKRWLAEHPKRSHICSYLLYNFRDESM
jgi:Zn-finger nucleic acid-binding protein